MPKRKLRVAYTDDNNLYLDHEKLKKLDLSGTSHCRSVWVGKYYVVKVDLPYSQQCHTEWTKWQQFTAQDQKYFAKIYVYGQISVRKTPCSYVVQRRVYGQQPTTDKPMNKVRELESKYHLSDLENRRDNVRIDCRDRLRIIDYGVVR